MYSAHRAVIFAIARISCFILTFFFASKSFRRTNIYNECCAWLAVLVTLSLEIKQDNRHAEFQSPVCPARKQLIDVVRPLLHCKLSQTSVNREDRVLVKLDVSGAPHPNIRWTSKAGRFVVTHWLLSKKNNNNNKQGGLGWGGWPHNSCFLASSEASLSLLSLSLQEQIVFVHLSDRFMFCG